MISRIMCKKIFTVRDLSEIIRGGGRVERERGSQLLRLRKGRGPKKWTVKRGRVMQI